MKQRVLTIMKGKLFLFCFSFLPVAAVYSQDPFTPQNPGETVGSARPCVFSGIAYVPQFGIGAKTRIIIGGQGSNDGAINFNAYQDPLRQGRSYATNMLPPGSSYVTGGNFNVSTWSAQIFLDNQNNLFRIRPGFANCDQEIDWKEGINMDRDGNIGIGTPTTFGYRLAINGSVACRGSIWVTSQGLAWPDYVFSPGYHLRPLFALEKEIQSLGHLPDVPAAERVESEGLDLVEMTAILLKKIEELTLYIIELNKEIVRLRENDRELNQKLEELDCVKEELEHLKSQINKP